MKLYDIFMGTLFGRGWLNGRGIIHCKKKSIDSVTLTIINNYLVNTCREMGLAWMVCCRNDCQFNPILRLSKQSSMFYRSWQNVRRKHPVGTRAI